MVGLPLVSWIRKTSKGKVAGWTVGAGTDWTMGAGTDWTVGAGTD